MSPAIDPAAAASGAGRLAGRLALVTGATRGIGRAVALAFAREGCDLVLVGRTQGALEALDDAVRALGRQASLVPADLTAPDVVERIGQAVWERWRRLDILAGIAADLGVLTPAGHIEPDVWRQVIDLNLTANWRLIRACDPLLRAAPAGRAIFVTDALARGHAYWGAYAASKAALEALVMSYAEEVGRVTAVRVNLVRPAPTRTRLRAQAFPGEDPAALRPPEDAAPAFVALAAGAEVGNGRVVDG
jgi:NAD(P)-dependent dehydrogenase (short-subunit alcohol dehydrogenase family)